MIIKKRGQLTFWVIIGLLIVAAVLVLLFGFKRNNADNAPRPLEPVNIQQFIENCVREEVYSAIDYLLPRGGLINDPNTTIYKNMPVPYLCYPRDYYVRCVNIHPILIQEIRKNIKDKISPGIINCFTQLEREVEKRGGQITKLVESPISTSSVNVYLLEDNVKVTIERQINVSLRGETRTYEKFESNLNSPIYNLAAIALEIASQESKYCSFETVGYSLFNPRYDIQVYRKPDSTKIYIIKDKRSGKELWIATKSCAIPSGLQ